MAVQYLKASKRKDDKASSDTLFNEILELYEDAKGAAELTHAEQVENLAFYLGYQYVQIGQDLDTRESQEICNFIQPIVRAATSFFLQTEFNPSVPSLKDDLTSRVQAEMFERVARSIAYNGTISSNATRDCLDWSRCTGISWMKACWDPTKGPKVAEEPTGEKNEFGEEIVSRVNEGDLHFSFCPSTDVFPDPSIRSRDDLRRAGAYLFHRQLLPVSLAEELYPEDFNGESLIGAFDTGSDTPSKLEDEYLDRPGTDRLTLCEVVQFWKNPTKKYPNGQFAVFTGNRLIIVGPNPYQPSRIPYIPLRGEFNRPDALRALGIVDGLKPQQRTVNRVESNKKELLDNIVKGRILAPHQSGVKKEEFDDLNNRVIYYNRGMPPTVMQFPDFPSGLFKYTDDLIYRAKQNSGYDDIAQGTVSPDYPTGRLFKLADDKAAQSRFADLKEYNEFKLDLVKNALYLMFQFYDPERKIKVLGENGKWMLMSLDDSYLESIEDLVCDVSSTLPQTPAMKLAAVRELYDAGLLSDDPQAKAARQMMADPYILRSSFEDHPEAREKARRHILTIKKGAPNPLLIFPHDNHQVYLEEMDRWRQTLEYEELQEQQRAQVDMACEQAEMYAHAQEIQIGQSAQNLGLASGKGMAPPAAAPEATPENGGQPEVLGGSTETGFGPAISNPAQNLG